MDFFEKAHVVRDNKCNDKKSAESMKKQMKQMLYGYKTCNNQIIKDSLNIKTDNDDSSSVSGFSDLNLTNSSIEDDINKEIIDCDNIDDVELLREISSGNGITSDISDLVKDTVSENSDNTKYGTSSLLNDCDLASETESQTTISESFDSNGELAMKILKEIKSRKNVNLKMKRKKSPSDNEIPKKISMLSTNTCSSDGSDSLFICTEELDIDSKHSNSPCATESEYIQSPPFVSITAIDMSTESFQDILGDYRHSTCKNMPSEHQNESLPSTKMFSEQAMNVDIHTEEDVSSLIPEVDEELLIEDIKDLETSLELIDDSTKVNDTFELHDESGVDISEEKIYNTKNNFEIYHCKNSCILVLKHPAELFVQGKVKINSLGGQVEVFGYTLKDELCEIYAPYYNFAQCIRTVANENCYYGLFGKLTNTGLTVSEAESIVTSLGTYDAVVYLEKLENKKIDFVETNFEMTNLFVKPLKYNDPYFRKTSDILACSLFSSRPLKYFKENPVWKQAHELASMDRSRGVVCGGKGVGKSTYLRYQVNKLLPKGPVLVLDLDPGQSEFTVAGNVSATIVEKPLLGPNFTHLKRPEVMFNIGIINTMDNVKRYACAIQRLIFYCYSKDELKNMPWIINTMGMTNTFGMKLMALVIIHSKPTYIIQYNSKTPKQCFQMHLNVETVKRLHKNNKKHYLFQHTLLPNDLDYNFILAKESGKSGKNSFLLMPKHERFLNYLAYFSELVGIWNTINLLAIIPYESCSRS